MITSTLQQEFLVLRPEASTEVSPDIIRDGIVFRYGAIAAALIVLQSVEQEGVNGVVETLNGLVNEATAEITSAIVAATAQTRKKGEASYGR